MKKSYITLFLLTLILCFSCQQEDYINDKDSTTIVSNELKSTTNDPIDQILGLPVNIIQPNDNEWKYLSAYSKDKFLCLYNQDDGSGRQKWIISKDVNSSGYCITLLGGNSKRVLAMYNGKAEVFDNKWGWAWKIKPTSNISNLYTIQSVYAKNNYNDFLTRATGEHVTCTSKIIGSAQEWEIQPVEDYELLSIEYIKNPKDILNSSLISYTPSTYNNGSDIEQSRTYTQTIRKSKSSSFSRTHGVSVSITASGKIGIPLLTESGINFNTTTTSSWTYGSQETEEETETRTYPLRVPARSTIIAELTMTRYTASITYVAKVRGKQSNRILTLTGLWKGVVVDNEQVKITQYDHNGKTLKNTYTIK